MLRFGTALAGLVLIVSVATVVLSESVGSWPEFWRPQDLHGSLASLDSLLQAGQYEIVVDGVSDLLRVHADDPRYGPQLSARLGVAHLRADRPRDAILHLENAVRGAPHEAEFHRNFASALMRLGRKGRALTEYREAVALAPDDAQNRREYGQALTELKSWSEAEKQLLIAERICQGCRSAVVALARMYLASGQDVAAAVQLRELLLAGPDEVLRRELVGALHRSDQSAELVTVLTDRPARELSALEINLLADADLELQQCERAGSWVAALPEAQTLPPSVRDDARFWATVSLSLLQGGELTAALTAVERAVALAPDNGVYLNNQVVLLQKLGREAAAAELWQRVLELDPDLQEKNR